MKNSIGGTLVYLYIGNETNKNELMDTAGSHNSSFRNKAGFIPAEVVLSKVCAKLYGCKTNKNTAGSHNSITLGANKGFALGSGLKCSFVKNYTAMK